MSSKYSPAGLIFVIIVLFGINLPQARSAGPWYVHPSGNDANTCLASGAATACATINGVLAKPGFVAGDTINVAAGLYSITLPQIVNQSAIILGPQANVDPRPSATTTRVPADTTSEAILDGNFLPANILEVTASNVEINGLHVRNFANNANSHGIGVSATSGVTIRYNIVSTTDLGANSDDSISLDSMTGGPNLIAYNYIFDARQDAIRVANSVGDVTIRNNDVEDSRSSNAGIYTYYNANGQIVIEGNVVTGQTHATGVSSRSAGIQVGERGNNERFNDLNAIIRNNTVTGGARWGISQLGRNVTITGNTISGNDAGGVLVSYDAGGGVPPTITYNNIATNGGVPVSGAQGGVVFATSWETDGIPPAGMPDITNNCIVNNTYGAYYWDSDPDPLEEIILMPSNWWGDPGGPGVNAANAISDVPGTRSIDATGFLTSEPASCTAPPGPPDDDEDDDDDGGSGGSSGGAVTSIPDLPAQLCVLVGGGTSSVVGASVSPGTVTDGDVFCRLINENGTFVTNPAEIGNADVLSRGVLQAVDVFGLTANGQYVVPFNTPVGICLLGSGQLLFLNAATQPRALQGIGASSQGGYTCGSIPNAGTVILSPGASAPAVQSSSAPAAPAPSGEIVVLDGCTITLLNGGVRLRTEPNTSSPVITTLPFDLSLQATGRSGGWYRVIYQDGQGWLSGDFVSTSGSC